MAISNYSTDLLLVTVNLRNITDWGETDPPFTIDPIDPRSTLRRGLGGNALRLDRLNPGATYTLNLNPDSPDDRYMKGLMNSGANITITHAQAGTLEASTATEGVIVNYGTIGRGGQTVTDAQYIIEFNSFSQV